MPIGLPIIATEIPASVHAAHTSPKGIQYPIGMTPQKAASLLVKAARHVKTDIRSKKTVGTGRQTGKGKRGNRVSNRVARQIVGPSAIKTK